MNFRFLILTGVALVVMMAIGSEAIFAYVMSSPNYRMQSDSLNIGGVRQNSGNYFSEDTIGEVGTGISSTTNYGLYAGYQQMQEVSLSLSVADTVVALSPNIGGLSGGQSNGSTSITVITDNAAGYTLSIEANSIPALATSSYSFADYTPLTTTTPDYEWLIASTDSEFGFSPRGTDILQKYKDNGLACGAGNNTSTDTCWYNFTTSSENIAQSSTANHPLGTATTLKLRAESGTSHLQVAGDYRATIIITAITN